MTSNQPPSHSTRPLNDQLDLDFAMQAAGLGAWELDPATGKVRWDDRCREIFGISRNSDISYEETLKYIHPDDVQTIQKAIQEAMIPESGGKYRATYRNIREDGQTRWVRSTGRSYFDETGQLVRFAGVAQDVTEIVLAFQKLEESEARYRTLSAELEQQVEQRTQELAAANEKLSNANAELVTTNQELSGLTDSLIRSNENLQKFAYVASHDLQEPLRKIQQFGDILKKRYSGPLGDGATYLERILSASQRMSSLIRDLLSYSRISTQRDTMVPVPLNGVVDAVLNDLELIIAETSAQITVELLPTVMGDTLQLGQLFQNLLSNALKFHRPETTPRIQVTAQTLTASQLPGSVKPTREAATYYQIDVRDNGIGFDEKYLDRIFEMFQRLHTLSDFAGTGVGLAICEKVAANHGGAITATSQPGQGATFTLYLPA